MNKNRLLLIGLGIFFLIFFSCSNSPNQIVSYTESETLRNYLQNKENSVTWTKSIEEEKLIEKIDAYENMASNIKLGPEVMRACAKEDYMIYPYIDNFGSLDISELKVSVKNHIEKLIEVINTDIYEFPDSVFNSEYLFNYVFFIQDFADKWYELYFEQAPYIGFKDQDEIEKNQEENEPITTGYDDFISKIIFAKPFISDSVIQVPVRMFFKGKIGYIDVEFYVQNDKTYKITQIEIINWEN